MSSRTDFIRLLPVLFLILGQIGCGPSDSTPLMVSWAEVPDRPWAGPEFWTNRLQDWEVRGGRLEAVGRLPMRTAHILTRRGNPAEGPLEMTVRMGLSGLEEGSSGVGPPEGGFKKGEFGLSLRMGVGVILGAGGPTLDPRKAALVHHSPGPGGGVFFGIEAGGHLVVADFSEDLVVIARSDTPLPSVGEAEFRLQATPDPDGVRVLLEATGPSGDAVSLGPILLPFQELTGALALALHGADGSGLNGWFSDLRLDGDGVEVVAGGGLGPILGAQHILSRGSLRLTAQLLPVSGPADGSGGAVPDSVRLEIGDEDGDWVLSATEAVVVPGYTATFQSDSWPSDRSVPYRLSYLPGPGRGGGGESYTGTIRAEPLSKEEMVVAAFTGNHNVASPGLDRGDFDWENHLWFPHQDIVDHVKAHDPDFLFFSGDQVYEGASPTRADPDHPYEDYLYKWYLWLWAFRDLTRDIPSVAIPDDHDVFHGNVWGAGGRLTPPGLSGAAAQDQGGYKLPADWVNMVQRTQAAHLPAPPDPTPSDAGIEVYFTDILYSGMSFAVLEDRKFKSPPKLLVPEADVWNGWAQNPAFDAQLRSDVPGASLLGARQEAFLERWAGDWGEGTWMKIVLSQTIFNNVATIPADAMSGSVIPSLPVPEPGVYEEGDKMAADMDSNGWPPSGRNRAVASMRKGFAVHLAGDQHLASTIQYGVEAWGDGPFALCVPSVANFWPRRWYPPQPGENRTADSPLYTGDFMDGFGNRMTVFAVSNPAQWGHEPTVLHNRAPGYGIARFNRTTREVSLEAWPRWANPLAGDNPYPGWPVRFHQLEGYGRTPVGYLPTLVVEGMSNPVVQVISETGGGVVYTLRVQGKEFTPWVFEEGAYTVRVGEPGTEGMRVFLGLVPTPEPTRTIELTF
jgi:alkaline phosphatase D